MTKITKNLNEFLIKYSREKTIFKTFLIYELIEEKLNNKSKKL
jgi:hypothetical protein